ncbi:hypothetical protein Q9L58_006934 [Maublancomyces gigas]|uniref:Uncharacterized protein n=1 Tax=Discina gigas TaxID=1032678 RepID=A0ABR3GDU4_9PEZI
MDGVPPRPKRKNPFTQVKNQYDPPSLFPLPLPCHYGIEEDQNSRAVVAVEMNSNLCAGADLMGSIQASEGTIFHSQSLDISIPIPIDNLHGAKAQELTTPSTQGPDSQHGQAVPCAPKRQRKQQSKVLRPASTRIRNPPKILCIPEAKTIAEGPKKQATKSHYRLISKREIIAPTSVAAESTVGLWEEEQFMQLLRDTIESNKNARSRRANSSLADNSSVYIPGEANGGQSPGYLDMRGNLLIDTATLSQESVLVHKNDAEVAKLPEKWIRDASEEVFIPTFKNEVHIHQEKRVQDPSGKSPIPAVVIIDQFPDASGHPLKVIDTRVTISPSSRSFKYGAVSPAAVTHASNPTEQEMALVPFG